MGTRTIAEAPGANVGAGADVDRVESARLARRTARLVPTAGLAGEAVLPPQRRGAHGLPASRLDETLISARVRELADRPAAKPPPSSAGAASAGSKAIDESAPRRR